MSQTKTLGIYHKEPKTGKMILHDTECTEVGITNQGARVLIAYKGHYNGAELSHEVSIGFWEQEQKGEKK